MTEPTRPGDRILRHEIPVDDQWHTLTLTGPIVHVAARRLDAVEAWALDHHHTPPIQRTLRVYGTGQALDPGVTHLGTALIQGSGLVWHLMEHLTRTVLHPDQWPILVNDGHLPAVQQWARDNLIDPGEVSIDAPVTIDTHGGQRIIRYTAFLRDETGHKYADPTDGNQAAREERTTPVLVEPPANWADGPREQP